jgi:hypothetical protein
MSLFVLCVFSCCFLLPVFFCLLPIDVNYGLRLVLLVPPCVASERCIACLYWLACIGLLVLACLYWLACIGLLVLACLWAVGLGLAACVPVARTLALGLCGLVIRLQLGVQLNDGVLQQIESDCPSTQRIVVAVAKAGHVRCQAEPCDGRVWLFTMALTLQFDVAALSGWRCTAFSRWFCLAQWFRLE